MSASTALVRVPKGRVAHPGVGALRRRMIERALDGAAVQPRVWLEVLEPRRMLNAAPVFDSHGTDKALFPLEPAAAYGWVTPNSSALTSDGKLLIVGELQGETRHHMLADPTQWAIARLNPDGSPDQSFGPHRTGIEAEPVGAVCQWEQVVPQPDGKLIVCGWCEEDVRVARFNADGSLDTTYGGGVRSFPMFATGPSGGGAAWLDASGELNLVGAATWDALYRDDDYANDYEAGIVTLRLGVEGAPDTRAGPDGWALAKVLRDDPSESRWPWVDAAGPLAGGGAQFYFTELGNGQPDSGAPLIRVALDDAGRLVASRRFVPDVPSDGGNCLVTLAPDGSAFVTAATADPHVEKPTPAGVPDESFGSAGVAVMPDALAFLGAVGADGRLLVMDSVWAADGSCSLRMLRFTPSGAIDPSFTSPTISDAEWLNPYATLVQPDGSVVLVGADDLDADPAGFVARTVFSDGRVSQPPAPSVPSPPTTVATTTTTDDGGDPAAMGGLLGTPAASGFGGAGAALRLGQPDDATVWDPGGTSAVYE